VDQEPTQAEFRAQISEIDQFVSQKHARQAAPQQRLNREAPTFPIKVQVSGRYDVKEASEVS